MRLSLWSVAVVLLAVSGIPGTMRAQAASSTSRVSETGFLGTMYPSKPVPGERSSRSGVYTAEQAARGEVVYAATCASCHDDQSLIQLETRWGNYSVWDLFQYSTQFTPRDNPGSLTAQQYVDVIAYIFSQYNLPMGTSEIAPSDSALRAIRIALKSQP